MQPVDSLTALGFTETEAKVYCELLRAQPATGYRLAQAVGKAPANTYQALAALVQKGAVLVDEAEAKTFRAVPPTELLAALERGFQARRSEAQAALEQLHAPAQDDRIYQLKTPAQVYERARAMLAAAAEVAVFDLFPAPFEALRPDLEAAAARGVRVAGVVYQPVEPQDGVTYARSKAADFVIQRWPGQQLSLVTDARQFLVALLGQTGGVRHAVWSDSGYLACLQHYGLAAEIRLHALTPAQEAEVLPDLTLSGALPPGLRTLIGVDGAAPLETLDDA